MLRKKHIIDEKSDFYQLIMLGMIEVILVVILIQLIFSLNNYRNRATENYIQMTEASAERLQSDIECTIDALNFLIFHFSPFAFVHKSCQRIVQRFKHSFSGVGNLRTVDYDFGVQLLRF